MIWLVLLIFPLSWGWLNFHYERIYGQHLKWYWSWASHGALLFRMRLPQWERQKVDT